MIFIFLLVMGNSLMKEKSRAFDVYVANTLVKICPTISQKFPHLNFTMNFFQIQNNQWKSEKWWGKC